jgi:hypothetical protein
VGRCKWEAGRAGRAYTLKIFWKGVIKKIVWENALPALPTWIGPSQELDRDF